MIDIFAMAFAVLCPALILFWPLKRERLWIALARCLVAIGAFWGWMAWAQHHDLVTRIADGRARDLGEAASMAGYVFGPSFWIIPGILYAALLCFCRFLWRICRKRTRGS